MVASAIARPITHLSQYLDGVVMGHPVHQDAPEGLPLQTPQPPVFHAGHRCRPRLAVHEAQLSKAHAGYADVGDYGVDPVVVRDAHLFQVQAEMKTLSLLARLS